MRFDHYNEPSHVSIGSRFVLAVLFLLLPVSGLAQDIEEVVIQAERQEESTLDVTESIDAFDLEDLETQQIKGFADISNSVPGLTASPSGSQGLRFTLRGVGARDNQLGVESKVGLYVDGAFLGRASGLVFDIVDLERVEVIKGPQGFTYGRNAIGGAINLITAKANVEEFYAKLDLKVGNFERRNFTGIVNLPVSENFAVRGSVFKNLQEGWVTNIGRGEDFGGYDREGFRISARWHASESVTIDYSFDQADFESQPVFYQPLFIEGETAFDRTDYERVPGNVANFLTTVDSTESVLFRTPQGASRLDQTNATVRDIENSTTEADGHSLAVEWAWSDQHTANFIATHRSSDVNNTFYFFPDVSSQEDVANAINSFPRAGTLNSIQNDSGFIDSTEPRDEDIPGFANLTLLGLSAGTAFGQQFGDAFAAFTDPASTPAESTAGRNALIALIASPEAGDFRVSNQLQSIFSSPPGGVAALKNHKQFSLEFKQTGFFLDDRIEYVTGVYYFNERTGNGQTLDGVLTPERDQLYLDIVELLDFGNVSADATGIGFSFVSLNELNTDALGIYANIKYTPLILDERIHLEFGLRYSRDERSLDRQLLQAIALVPRGDLESFSNEWDSLDPRFKIVYDMTEDLTTYFSLTSGYRGGNYNVDARELPDIGGGEGSVASDIEFDTESLIAYEFGIKGSMFDGLLDLEFATYYYDISDGQETVIFPTSPISRAVVNADGYAYGIEIDTNWNLTDELSLVVNYALLRSGTDVYVTPFVEDFGQRVGPVDDPSTADFNEELSFRSLVLQCSGGLRRVDLENGRCVERKSNFGAPVNSWQTSLNYRLPTSYGEFFVFLGYNFKDEFFVNDTLQVDSRHIWDLRIQSQFDLDSGVARVALWSQNLFDNEYQLQKFELNNIALDIAAYGPPRTYGIDLIYEWF